jgi:hypothetical protein
LRRSVGGGRRVVSEGEGRRKGDGVSEGGCEGSSDAQRGRKGFGTTIGTPTFGRTSERFVLDIP